MNEIKAEADPDLENMTLTLSPPMVNSTLNEFEKETKSLVCGISSEEYEYFEMFVRPWIGFTLYAFIPISTIFIFNILIIRGLMMMKKIREKKVAPKPNEHKIHPQQLSQTHGTNETGLSTATSDVTQADKQARHLTSLTMMFLAVSITFLILITPSICNIIARPYWVHSDEDQKR